MSVGKVIKSGMWLFVGSALFNVLGYLYWIIISFFIPPAIMGSAATVLALYSPIVAALSFGLPIGVRRSLGSSWADNDLKSLTDNEIITIQEMYDKGMDAAHKIARDVAQSSQRDQPPSIIVSTPGPGGPQVITPGGKPDQSDPESPQETKKCPKCVKDVPIDAKNCPYCPYKFPA